MTVGVLIITHEQLGDVLLHNTEHILGVCPLQTKTLNVPFNADPDALLGVARELVQSLDEGDGVLVLTDLYGLYVMVPLACLFLISSNANK